MKPAVHMVEQIDGNNLSAFEARILITCYTILGALSASGLPMHSSTV
jgi:hypothetical protein